MKGQAATEYLLIFAVMLAIFTAVTWAQMINPAQEAGGDALYLSQARSATDAIAGAINSVYCNGRGAVKSVSLSMDHSWSLQLDNSQNKLRIVVQTSQGTENVEDNLRYKIDNYHSLSNISAGTYTVIVVWPENTQIPENIDGSSIGNNKVYIYIGPCGG